MSNIISTKIRTILIVIINFLVIAVNGICQSDSTKLHVRHRIQKMTGKVYDDEKKDSVIYCYFIYDSLGRLKEESESPLCGISYEYVGNTSKISKKSIWCGESSSNGEYIFTYPNDTTTIMEFSGSINNLKEKTVSNSKGNILYTIYSDSIIGDNNFQPEHKIIIYTEYSYSKIDFLPNAELETQISMRKEINYKSGNNVESTREEVQIYRFYSEFDSLTELRRVEANGESSYIYKYDSLTHKKTHIEYFGREPYDYKLTHIRYDKNGNIELEFTAEYCRYEKDSIGNYHLKDSSTFSKKKEFKNLVSGNMYKDGRLIATLLYDPCIKSLSEFIVYSYQYFD